MELFLYFGGIDMTYGQQVLSRLDLPGLALMLIGIAPVLLPAAFWTRVGGKDPGRVKAIVSLAGLALAVIGALRLLDFIG